MMAEQIHAQSSLRETDSEWARTSLADLCDHIQETHHAYLRRELPRVDALAREVAAAGEQRQPEMLELSQVVVSLRAELESHMLKEERVLFPICRHLDTARQLPEFHCGSVRNPIAVMAEEHSQAQAALQRMARLTNDFTLPRGARPRLAELYDRLRQLGEDLQRHIRKEDQILFPKAVRAEERLGG